MPTHAFMMACQITGDGCEGQPCCQSNSHLMSERQFAKLREILIALQCPDGYPTEWGSRTLALSDGSAKLPYALLSEARSRTTPLQKGAIASMGGVSGKQLSRGI